MLDTSGETVWGGIWPKTLWMAAGTGIADKNMGEEGEGKMDRCWGVDEETGKWFIGLEDGDLEVLVKDE